MNQQSLATTGEFNIFGNSRKIDRITWGPFLVKIHRLTWGPFFSKNLTLNLGAFWIKMYCIT